MFFLTTLVFLFCGMSPTTSSPTAPPSRHAPSSTPHPFPHTPPPHTQLQQLDDLQRQLLKIRILRALRLSEVPYSRASHSASERKNQRKTHLAALNVTAAEGPKPNNPPHHSIRLLPTTTTTTSLNHSSDGEIRCRLQYEFRSVLGLKRRGHSLLASEGQVWIPRRWAEGEAEVVLGNTTLAFLIHNQSRESPQGDGYHILDLCQLFLSPDDKQQHRDRIHIALGISVSKDCPDKVGGGRAGAEKGVPFVVLGVREVVRGGGGEGGGGRGREGSGASKRDVGEGRLENLVIDCATQWDRAMLNSSSHFVSRDLLPCCRRRIGINFTEIGWNEWIIAPASFNSYYCLGRCTSYGGFPVEETEGLSFYAEIMNARQTAEQLGLRPCCSPVKFKPLTVTYLMGEQEEITQTLDDVIVDRCGCL